MIDRTVRLVILGIMVIGLFWPSLLRADEAAVVNPSFEQGAPGEAPDHWRVPKVPGYHVLVSDDNPKSGKHCVTIKPDRENPGPMGNVMQRIDATPFRGKRVRYRAAVRSEIEGQNGTAQLWMRVDLLAKDGQRKIGFLDNMSDRPIREKEWAYYEIVGDIAEEAERISLGMFVRGSGQAWLDDVSLEIVDQDTQVTKATGDMPFAKIGPGLLEMIGAMRLQTAPTSADRTAKTSDATNKKTDDKETQTATVLLPMPLAYREQVPVTYELTVDPPEATQSVTVYQDTAHNHVARVTVVLGGDREAVDIQFRSLVLVDPSPFGSVPDRAEIPDQWPEDCRPWLTSTWCVDGQHDQIQAVSKEICDTADDVMGVIAGVKAQTGRILANVQGRAKDLTAVSALTGRGSCTSNANLMAALLRASHIPARVVAGYPSWSGPLQTHYIVEAYVPKFGWYPIEPTMGRSPWPNEYQVNVAVIPPKYETEALADWRPLAAGGVPFLSLTEMPDGPSNIICRGTIDRAQNCDHHCRMIRKFPTEDTQWDVVLDAARSRWRKWLASKPRATEDGQLSHGPKPDAVTASSPTELMKEL